jgi:hypothetical protein
MLNLTVNDLEINSTLDQAAMANVLGGYSTTYGTWNNYYSSSSSSSSISSGSWGYTGRLFQKKRVRYQFYTRTTVKKWKRKITDMTNFLGH